jgi:hexokinase
MAGLTRQHFKEIANCINKVIGKYAFYNEETEEQLFKEIATNLSNYFKTQNPLFNENQFKKACLK